MLANQLAAAIEAAPTFKAIDNLARLTWRGLAEGHIADAAAERLGAAVESRRAAIRSKIAVSVSNGVSESRRASRGRPRSPDRQRSIERRRRVAASGIMPGRLACNFTQGEVAVLSVIGREVKRTQRCEMPLDKIAALAGVCRTVVKTALRQARDLRLINVIERPRPGRRSDTNLVTIISPEWREWLRLGNTRDRGQKSGNHVLTKKKPDVLPVDNVETEHMASFASRQSRSESVAQQKNMERGATERTG